MKYTSKLVRGTILGSLAFVISATPAKAAADLDAKDLLNLSLEQLSNIEVTSVSKKSEKASEAAAAIFVITQEDIRHSGMTNIPELLRMVPGLNVAQAGSHQWAITSRGSNDQFANKLLVLIDGRTVYTPLFSGVFWDTQDVPLQDIERIEVIRGPGATLWGANAVNGVINIITKSAQDTLGGYLSQSVGNQVNSLTTVRYGAKMAEDAYVRVYAKYDDYKEFQTRADTTAADPWNKKQTGFRADWKQGERESFTFQGDLYHATEKNPLNLPLSAAPFATVVKNDETDMGGNLLGRWDHRFSGDSNMTLQMYYDDARRDNYTYYAKIQTFDIDVQHIWTALQGHEIVWGGGYRLIKSSTRPTDYIQFAPPSRTDNLFSTFIQDEIALIPTSLFLTLGTKLEHNDYTGFELEPSARLSWLVDENQTLWGSVSHAVRAPSISQDDLQLVVATLAPGLLAARVGDNSSKSEELTAYEIGYRIQPEPNVSLDAAAFYNDYKRLILGGTGPVTGPFTNSIGVGYFLSTVLPLNVGTAHSWGFEGAAKWNPSASTELSAGYSLLQLKFDQPDPFGFSFTGKSPQQQFNLRSAVELPHDVEWSSGLYYVDRLASLGVKDYYRLDTKITWKPLPSLELSLVGQNLLYSSHQEFTGFLYQNAAKVPRSIYGNITWKF